MVRKLPLPKYGLMSCGTFGIDESCTSNWGYVLGKPLPMALPEGSSPVEHVMFEQWLEDNRKGHWKGECPQLLSNLGARKKQKKLSKDEMILRLGDGKTVVVEIWHTRLGHISKDRMRKLMDSKSLEVDYLDNLPTCESCLKWKMTKKSFVGQSVLANGLLDLIHTDVCGPLNTPIRGGYSYFITFTGDHVRYDYVYLMRYKFEAFGMFTEYRLEVENQTGHKIKALRSDPGREYLSSEFIDYLKENEILS
ncbi:Retrovirus-related Pol polyprotein from transposon TNT 1-94 [Sesamum angolense]|uniref:Retrovirus-related Pol polyprotein from transposon TNT 1-94 n=1 Tax=Sesamum angolense TaxID=2727404 RepID=A0AAE2BK21_9LAMI|nr:Retrovirus-related Pol polyprotein from transposon TNT 1-94 [Sesamum angolense]